MCWSRLLDFLCVFYTHLLTNLTHIKKENTHKYTVCVNIMNKTFDWMDMCMFLGCCDAVILWIRCHLGSEPQFFMQTIWNSNDCSDHGQYYFFIMWLKYMFRLPKHVQMDTSRLTIGSKKLKLTFQIKKQLKNSIRDEQDASCHCCHHIRQMYKGMIAYSLYHLWVTAGGRYSKRLKNQRESRSLEI